MLVSLFIPPAGTLFQNPYLPPFQVIDNRDSYKRGGYHSYYPIYRRVFRTPRPYRCWKMTSPKLWIFVLSSAN